MLVEAFEIKLIDKKMSLLLLLPRTTANRLKQKIPSFWFEAVKKPALACYFPLSSFYLNSRFYSKKVVFQEATCKKREVQVQKK